MRKCCCNRGTVQCCFISRYIYNINWTKIKITGKFICISFRSHWREINLSKIMQIIDKDFPIGKQLTTHDRFIWFYFPSPSIFRQERALLISTWIDIAQELRLLKNFSSLKAIISGLQSNSVYRLNKTWTALCKEKVRKKFYVNMYSSDQDDDTKEKKNLISVHLAEAFFWLTHLLTSNFFLFYSCILLLIHFPSLILFLSFSCCYQQMKAL